MSLDMRKILVSNAHGYTADAHRAMMEIIADDDVIVPVKFVDLALNLHKAFEATSALAKLPDTEPDHG